jgi:hypothetical protein
MFEPQQQYPTQGEGTRSAMVGERLIPAQGPSATSIALTLWIVIADRDMSQQQGKPVPL